VSRRCNPRAGEAQRGNFSTQTKNSLPLGCVIRSSCHYIKSPYTTPIFFLGETVGVERVDASVWGLRCEGQCTLFITYFFFLISNTSELRVKKQGLTRTSILKNKSKVAKSKKTVFRHWGQNRSSRCNSPIPKWCKSQAYLCIIQLSYKKQHLNTYDALVHGPKLQSLEKRSMVC
jgi:hypothetical protein